MTVLKLCLPNQRNAFEPGEAISVTADWTLAHGENLVEMRLVWQTSGKGATDREVVNNWRFHNPAVRDSKLVDVTLPISPYSFSGKLISLSWTFELIAMSSGESTRADIIIAPECREIVLHQNPQE